MFWSLSSLKSICFLRSHPFCHLPWFLCALTPWTPLSLPLAAPSAWAILLPARRKSMPLPSGCRRFPGSHFWPFTVHLPRPSAVSPRLPPGPAAPHPGPHTGDRRGLPEFGLLPIHSTRGPSLVAPIALTSLLPLVPPPGPCSVICHSTLAAVVYLLLVTHPLVRAPEGLFLLPRPSSWSHSFESMSY